MAYVVLTRGRVFGPFTTEAQAETSRKKAYARGGGRPVVKELEAAVKITRLKKPA